jgi:hypothetical protein
MAEEISGDEANGMRVFHAMVTRAEDPAYADRVTVLAVDRVEASRLLGEKHGAGNVFYLHDPLEAERLQ